MTLPTNVTTIEITGTYLSAEGLPLTGQVSFAVSSPLVDTVAQTKVMPTTVRRKLDSNGHFTVVLPVTDDADLGPSGWYYIVSERIDRYRTDTWFFQLPASMGDTADITELVRYTPPA